MTLPHPRAVGTYGPEADEVFARLSGGKALRWWQRLANHRILEHDADGLLVWPEYFGTISRQGGKSVDLRVLALWRILHAALRWGDQLVLHTGRDLAIVREVLTPAQTWGEMNGLVPSRNNMQPGLSTGEHMTGSRWLIKAKHAVYGFSPGNALVDEVWDVPARAVDEGIEPATVEQVSPQLGLWSTAHRLATGLGLERRAAAIAELFAPVSRLLLEWSTPADVARDDRRGWRMASPHWSAARERLIERAYEKVLRGESVDPEEPDPIASFDAQWLNRWPGRVVVEAVLPGERLVPENAWSALVDVDAAPAGPLWVGVEDNLGHGAAAAAAGLTEDGRVVVGGWEFESKRDAFQWARGWTEAVPGSRMLVGASLADDLEVQELTVPVETAGKSETPTALALLRQLVKDSGVVHDGAEDLARHVDGARVRVNPEGSSLSLVGAARSDLLRVAAWCVERADRDRGARVAIH